MRPIFRNVRGMLATVVIAAGFAALISGCSSGALREENARLRMENDSLRKEVALLEARTADLIRSQPGLSAAEREEFRKRGLKDPQTELIENLGGREELMPLKGIFGARPSFYKEVRVYILNGKWAYASWDMGERVGQRLFEYTVSETGEIRWKIIDTWIR